MTKLQGNLYVIAAPSGTGKTSLVKALLAATNDLTVSVSYTTRPKRPNEEDGVNYHFINKADFEKMLAQDEFLEHAIVFDNLYGTSKAWVAETLAKGQDVILEIDWQGHQQIKKLFSDAISVFILPPSRQALKDRLVNRQQDDANIIEKRLADMQEAVSHASEFNYIVLNDEFERAVADLKAIIRATHLSSHQQLAREETLFNNLKSQT